jgi:F0F1-type ATP synthase assembly protein I
MAVKNRNRVLGRSLKAFQQSAMQAGPAAAAGYTLIGSILVLGALGYGFDAWRGTSPWGLLVGLGLGMAVGFYELVRTAWRR